MNKNIFLALLLISIYDFAQANERLIQKWSDPFHKSEETETVADRIRNVTAYRDFAVKQLDDATAHPKLALVIPDDSPEGEKTCRDFRKADWSDAARIFSEALSLYENAEYEEGDDRLTTAFCFGTHAIGDACRYWYKKNLQTHTPLMILEELLDAISDTPGSPAEYPGIRNAFKL